MLRNCTSPSFADRHDLRRGHGLPQGEERALRWWQEGSRGRCCCIIGAVLMIAHLASVGHGERCCELLVSLALLVGRFVPSLLRGKLNPAVYVVPLAIIGAILRGGAPVRPRGIRSALFTAAQR